jgi:hypothetical protein
MTQSGREDARPQRAQQARRRRRDANVVALVVVVAAGDDDPARVKARDDETRTPCER